MHICFMQYIKVIGAILAANQTHNGPQSMREHFEQNDKIKTDYGVLFFKDRLLVPNRPNLRTGLIRDVYDKISNAYTGRKNK